MIVGLPIVADVWSFSVYLSELDSLAHMYAHRAMTMLQSGDCYRFVKQWCKTINKITSVH